MLNAIVSGYRVVELVAKGGMGEVYLARHEMMQREAAIKVLHSELGERHDLADRFINEARAAASIRHPGIVEVFDVGYTDGRAYIIMEFLRGEMLATRLVRQRVPIRNALTWVRQLAGALGAAHACGIIHRDLKPENIFVIPDPDVQGGERTKILDFGIAKLLESQVAGQTVQGSMFGTPAYMSPEQCENAATVDSRADLYSLGCIFYELLTGEPPFGHGGMELVAAHLRDQPEPVRARVPSVSEELEQVVLRLLEKQPDQRFDTCDAFTRALDHAVSEQYGVSGDALLVSGPAATKLGIGVAEDDEVDDGVAAASSPVPTAAGAGDAGTGHERPSALSTVAGSSGQIAADEVVTTARNVALRRWLLVAALTVVGALAAVGAAVVALNTQPLESALSTVGGDAKLVEEALSSARLAADQRRWDDTLVEASRALEELEGAPDSEQAHEARSLRELAQEEQRNYYTFEFLQRAVREQALSAAQTSYEELSGRSVYRAPGRKLLDELRVEWLSKRREQAEAAAGDGQCQRVADVAKEVAAVVPDAQPELRQLVRDCRAKRRRNRSDKRPL